MLLVVMCSISSSLEMFTLGRCSLTLIGLVSNNMKVIVMIIIMMCQCVVYTVVR